MKALPPLYLLRAAALVALGTSVALLFDYTSSQPAFCSSSSGCAAVRHSGLGYIPLGGLGTLPVPVVGIIAFLTLLFVSLQKSPRVRAQLATPLSYASAAGAVGFIGLQVAIGHFCSLCMIVDTSALVCGYAAFRLKKVGWDDPSTFRLSGWIYLSALGILAPLLFPLVTHISEVPESIRALYNPQKLTIVEFFDYQCPHCRELSPRLKELAKADASLQIRLGYTPLPSHDQARNAARITICAAQQGHEWEVASKFFSTGDLSQAHLLEVAHATVGDPTALDHCLASELPDRRIEEDTARIKEAGFEGLPTTYIGGTRLLGALDDVVYKDAIRRAKDGSDTSGLNPWVFLCATLALFVTIIITHRNKKVTNGS